jgi:SAM-dependent methyltransferase
MKLFLSAILKNVKETADPRNLPFLFRELYWYAKDYYRFANQYKYSYPLRLMPILFEKTTHSAFDPQYTCQAYWTGAQIMKNKSHQQPHIDISSNVSFVAQLSAMTEVIQVEYRPPKLSLPALTKVSGDVLCLPFADNSLFSMSCLHVVEHIGLGRYGDKINVNGCWQALAELERVMAPGGKLYLSVPVGNPGVFFNGCYVFNAMDIIEKLAAMLLVDFAWVDDQGKLVETGHPEDTGQFTCGLGLFSFEKRINISGTMV